MKEKATGRKVLVTGAGGFIGYHLVNYLKARGMWVRGVDIREPRYEPSAADEFILEDLRFFENCARAVRGVQDVYQLAADMGGIGYITASHATLSRNNGLINANMLEASRQEQVERYLYTSSACVYPSFLQDSPEGVPLKEQDAIPADPEKGYGWEKLFSEQLTSYFHEDHGMDVRIVRLHNVYGPLGTYEGGREKAPAAICRKVAEADEGSVIDIWGDGKQTRSFCYVDDCVEGMFRIMESGYSKPVNLGTEEVVTVNRLVDLVIKIAGKNLKKVYSPTKPQGVRGRNSDNSLLRSVLHWEPKTTLSLGLEETYTWIWTRLQREDRARPPAPRQIHRAPSRTA